METADEIDRLLREAQALGGDALEFTRVHLETFRREMAAVVLWQRSEGRDRVVRGEEPDVIVQEVNAKIAEVSEGFRGRLERLIAWARGGESTGH